MKKTIPILLILIVSLIFSGVVFASDNSVTVVSDTSVMVSGPLTYYAPLNSPDWGTPKPAKLTWKHDLWPMLANPNAKWISTSYLIGDPDDGGPIAASTWRKFNKTVEMCPGAYNISGTISANADNAEVFYVNGVEIYSQGPVEEPPDDYHWWYFESAAAFTPVDADELELEFIVRNFSTGDQPEINPTGLIFSSEISYDCPLTVIIDVKPGSYPSCFRNDGSGVIPVAIFGSEDFDVTQINPNSIKLDGLKVVSKNKSNKLMIAYEDINGDGYMDMVVKIEDVAGNFPVGMGEAILTGELGDGRHIRGVGDICVRK